MNEDIKMHLKESSLEFRLPRYKELPNVGLYLEQVAKYINGFLVSVNCAEITTSMISNYVKKGCIPPPQKKQYYPEQIAYLIFIAVAKNVLSLENIIELFDMQRDSYTLPKAYDYFCAQLEHTILYVFGHTETLEDVTPEDNSAEKLFLKNIVISVSHSIYLNFYFGELKKQKDAAHQHQIESEKEHKEREKETKEHTKKEKKKQNEAKESEKEDN